MRRRAGRVTAVLAALLACGVSPAGPAEAAAGQFHKVAVVHDLLSLQSAGGRFVAAVYWRDPTGDLIGVMAFDTLRGRGFRLTPPAPECHSVAVGGGFVAWSCGQHPGESPPLLLLTDLSTRQNREPAGDPLPWAPWYSCGPVAIGRQWMELDCGNVIGPRATRYFNHRDGRLTEHLDPYADRFGYVDLDSVNLLRQPCAPLTLRDGSRPPSLQYKPPWALIAPGGDPDFVSIRLRRCGSERAETLSRCPQKDCRSPQLGSGYVTWGEHKNVYAYLPRIRRRVLVGRAPADRVRGRKLFVAHTCDRIFARWDSRVYAARFDPRRGAPPCQSRISSVR